MDYELIIPIIAIPILLFIWWRIRVVELATYHSPKLGLIKVKRKYNGERLLTVNETGQGISIDHPSLKRSYWYWVAKETVKHCQKQKSPQVLMLGLGANTITQIINRTDPKISQTIIEYDPLIIQICRKYFNLNELTNSKLIKANAYQAVKPKSNILKGKYDVIIVDLFIGKPPFVSPGSNKLSFIEQLRTWLKPKGILIFNRPGHTKEARVESQELKKTLLKLFKQSRLVDIKDPRGYRSNLVTAYDKIS